ncbi:MAG: tripartite tricarboxylate transporter substrate binding protein [Curvibacter lanceolatus]|uniref:Bug family tripartite tricarboxylate transporter substrate binding protein n=1 Tax=Curvibacter lanceolatus TaxID=86182 RepID=UPI00035CF71E|nr:tripartite tricarboxylate transporter substrate binding protein [Curvibacter lanceolatus]MBV5295375.1 tripartite tricarboxylate transporter substrate binding protein [Curvibacter lanceolatus]
MQRNTFLTALATSWLGLALGSSALAAANDKPLEWVVGYAAGGGSDVVARAIAESMGTSLGRTIVINNKPGAGTNIAAEYAARSKDYGNLVFSADFATLAANPFLFSKLSYNAEKDFQPVGLLVRFPMFLVVSNQVPVSNYKEFVAWAKTQTDGVNWASAGPGSPHHLVGELFREQSGLKLTHVPYRGAAPAITDVVGGQVPAMWVDSATAYPFLNGGKLKAIGVASPQRVSTMPEVPTLNEQGLKGFEGYAWQGLVVPTGTPPEVVSSLSKALQTALNSTTVKARLQALGVEPLPGTPAQMASYAKTEREKWGRVIKQVGVKLD